MNRIKFTVVAMAMSTMAAGPAFADDKGSTSGPAAGKPVEPSTAVQKQNPYNEQGAAGQPSGTSAGSPGVEGSKGTQSGQEWVSPKN